MLAGSPVERPEVFTHSDNSDVLEVESNKSAKAE